MLINDQMPDLSRYQKPEQQINALYQYVYNLRQQINHVLSNLDGDNLGADLKSTIAEIQAAVSEAVQQTGGKDEQTQQQAGITEEKDPTVPDWAKEKDPPAQKVLSVNGKEGEVKLTAADVGAAPSGYGLGTTNGRICTDFNTAVEIGWYCMAGDGVKNGPSFTINFNYGALRVERRYGQIIQTATYQNMVASRYSADSGSTWSTWRRIDPPEVKSHTVTVNTAFVNTGNIKAHSVNGVLTIGGYFQTKGTHTGDGSTTTVICTIEGVKAKGQMYATMNTHANGRAFNILLFTDTSTNKTVVQIDLAPYSISSGTWINFGIVGIVEV